LNAQNRHRLPISTWIKGMGKKYGFPDMGLYLLITFWLSRHLPIHYCNPILFVARYVAKSSKNNNKELSC
jgi:hypothetical protein